jgi:hypothetical protein
MKGLTNVLKGEGHAHSPCHACSECAYLSVDVCGVGQRRPSTHTHDGTVGGTTQFHGHGTTGSKAVQRYSVESVALRKESVASGSPADRSANVTVCDHGCASIGMIDLVDCLFVQTRTDVCYSLGEGRHRAKRSAKCFVMDHRPFCAIFGIGNADRSAVRAEEGVDSSRMMAQDPFSPEMDVTFPEWDGASFPTMSRQRVFPKSQKVKEGNGDQVGRGMLVLHPPVVAGDCFNGQHREGQVWLGRWVLVAITL